MADVIRLTGVRATGFHGVLAAERRDGQEFVADVALHLDLRAAAASDDLAATVSYADLALGVAEVLAGPPADLIETVAERIAALALTDPRVEAVDVVVHKPQAPIRVPFADVSVEVHRSRDQVPVADPTPAAMTAPPPYAPPPAPLPQPVPTGTDPDVEPFAGDRLDAAPQVPVPVVLALGSNLGASQETLRRAVADLAQVAGLEVTQVAPLARTAAVGPPQPDILNTVVLGRTTLSPRGLLHACQEIEQRYGRVREERWGPRTLDIDLVVHGDTVAVADDLELPHPRAHQRAFVLQPWAQADPGAYLPGLGGGPVAALATTAPDRDGVRWLALDWWSPPETRP